MTRIYHAYSAHPQTWRVVRWDDFPVRVLVSFPYLAKWRKDRDAMGFRPAAVMLDSGAFTAWNSGKPIDRDALTAETLTGAWDECVALDVIGDKDASLANALAMKAAGSPAYPVFHIGEPMELLDTYCDQFPKVGLSCRLGEPLNESMEFLAACFRRRWPHRFHSFGWIGKRPLEYYPFESADAVSWKMSAIMGVWHAFNRGIKCRKNVSLAVQFRWFWNFEQEVTARWARELAKLRPSSAASPTT